MLAKLLLAVLLLAAVSAEETKRRHKYQDPFALLDKHMSMALSHDHSLIPHLATQYFWPWTELAKAVVALDGEDALEEPHVQADPHKFEIKLDVRHFAPSEIKVKVKERTILIEGKHIVKDLKLNKKYVANHFVQRYTLADGVDPEEVTAVLKANKVLIVSAPRHRPTPPPPEREIVLLIEEPEEAPVVEDVRPILVEKRPETEDTKEEDDSEETVKRNPNPTDRTDSDDQPSDQKRLKQQLSQVSSEETSSSKEKDPSPVTEKTVDSSTFVGKIRKKELKNNTKDPKKNETKKPMENNVLDYATVIDAE